VEGDGNVLSKNKVTLNVLDGIYVTGHNNLLYQNDLTGNGRHGINADSANGASHNDLDGNDGRENALQGIHACGQNDLGHNTGQENGVSPQVDFSCAGAGPATFAKFFVTDNQDDKVYKYDASGVPVGDFNLSGGNKDPSGVAVAGSDVYVLDKKSRRVYRYTDSGGAPKVSAILKEGKGNDLGKPTGLALDGDELWLVDDGKKKSYRYSLAQAFSGSASLKAAQEIAFTGRNGSAEGLAIDGTFLYVLDDSSKQFYRYPRAGGQGTASRTMRRVDGGALSTPAGAKLDGQSVWVVDKAKVKVCEYTLGSLFSGTGNLSAVSEFALTSNNGDAQGL
jgi:parallel beta-helix repeat protein